MGIVVGFIYVLILTVIIALFFTYGLSIKGPWGSFWTFFLILFFTIWLAHIWAKPFGPNWNNIYWLPPIGVGLIVALILAAVTPRAHKKISEIINKPEIDKEITEEEVAEKTIVTVGIFFWIVLFILFVSVIIGLIYQPQVNSFPTNTQINPANP